MIDAMHHGQAIIGIVTASNKRFSLFQAIKIRRMIIVRIIVRHEKAPVKCKAGSAAGKPLTAQSRTSPPQW